MGDDRDRGIVQRPDPSVGLAGFGVLLGWHFLILYFSFPKDSGIIPVEFVFVRQVVLNASLCVFFAAFGHLMSRLPQRDDIRSHAIAYSAMAAGTVGSIALIASSSVGIALSIVAVVMIGAAEAALMLFWLRFYTETAENRSGVGLGASAVLASLISFFTFHLTYEVSLCVLVILPLVSGLLLVRMTSGIPLRKNDPSGSGIPDWGSARKPYWKATAQLMAMALFFGIVQGCSSPEGTLLPAADPLTMLGAAVAGILLFAMYARSKRLPNLNLVISVSLLMYIVGMLLLPFHVPRLPQVAAFLIMTGFILCFILTLILVIDLCRTFDLNATIAVGKNQALEYAMFAIGIAAGNALWARFGNAEFFPFAVSSVAVFTLCAIVLFLTTERPPWEAAYYKPKRAFGEKADCDEPDPDEGCGQEADITPFVCVKYSLTPRESEVFALLSKGRNAEFIQNALFISNHTAKTHIYNIYRKMDVHSLQDLLDVLDAERARFCAGSTPEDDAAGQAS